MKHLAYILIVLLTASCQPATRFDTDEHSIEKPDEPVVVYNSVAIPSQGKVSLVSGAATLQRIGEQNPRIVAQKMEFDRGDKLTMEINTVVSIQFGNSEPILIGPSDKYREITFVAPKGVSPPLK